MVDLSTLSGVIQIENRLITVEPNMGNTVGSLASAQHWKHKTLNTKFETLNNIKIQKQKIQNPFLNLEFWSFEFV